MQVLALSYAGQMRLKKSTWLVEEDFHMMEPKVGSIPETNQAPAASQASVASKTTLPVRSSAATCASGKADEGVNSHQSPSVSIADVRGLNSDASADQTRESMAFF